MERKPAPLLPYIWALLLAFGLLLVLFGACVFVTCGAATLGVEAAKQTEASP